MNTYSSLSPTPLSFNQLNPHFHLKFNLNCRLIIRNAVTPAMMMLVRLLASISFANSEAQEQISCYISKLSSTYPGNKDCRICSPPADCVVSAPSGRGSTRIRATNYVSPKDPPTPPATGRVYHCETFTLKKGSELLIV